MYALCGLVGRLVFASDAVLQSLQSRRLLPLQYVDDDGTPTDDYPLNPNGSPAGIAALCSDDGRHLAVMPHPERSVLMWQWPWTPPHWQCTGTQCKPALVLSIPVFGNEDFVITGSHRECGIYCHNAGTTTLCTLILYI